MPYAAKCARTREPLVATFKAWVGHQKARVPAKAPIAEGIRYELWIQKSKRPLAQDLYRIFSSADRQLLSAAPAGPTKGRTPIQSGLICGGNVRFYRLGLSARLHSQPVTTTPHVFRQPLDPRTVSNVKRDWKNSGSTHTIKLQAKMAVRSYRSLSSDIFICFETRHI
jgi:hypothetical protein